MVYKSFPSKLLMFGEYLVIEGADSLALPFNKFSGCFTNNIPVEEQDKNFALALKMLLDYVEKNEFLSSIYNTKLIDSEINNNLYFKSNIPIGYGLGSSGCLTAAFYDSFGHSTEISLTKLKSILAKTESCFHGSSSGMDPLVCFTSAATMVQNGNIVHPSNPLNFAPFFLLNSGKARNTMSLVAIFKSKLENEAFADITRNTLVPLNNRIIDSLNNNGIFDHNDLERLSTLQLEHFSEMILPEVREVWEYGLNEKKWVTKLCGAGGGGFYLVFPVGNSQDEFEEYATEFELIKVTNDDLR